MTVTAADIGFHDGERAVQERAGVRAAAARLESMLAPGSLSGGLTTFLAAQTFAVLVGRDGDDRLWASPLVGGAGFLSGRDDVLIVGASPEGGDPLQAVPARQAVAVIAPDLTRRRRVRVNGWLSAADDDHLTIDVAEAYGNCPAYITPRALASEPAATAGSGQPALDTAGLLTADAVRIVEAADTFFLGTQHPQRGADASHKGGEPGFVEVDGADLVWPDYVGNNMFNSLGNLEVAPDAALLFVDFHTGDVLQLTGTATIEWRPADAASGETGRSVRFRPGDGVLRTSSIRGRGRPHRPAASSR